MGNLAHDLGSGKCVIAGVPWRESFQHGHPRGSVHDLYLQACTEVFLLPLRGEPVLATCPSPPAPFRPRLSCDLARGS